MRTKSQILAGIIGSGLEWYDFAIYGSFANIIALHFFPADNKFNAILATFAIFAIGFLMRPLGGFLFGHIGDRIGRSRALVLTVFGMTFPTVLIGLLPSYAQVGILAPLLLLLARLIQGLMIGGEYTGALLFLAEDEAPNRRAQTACLAMISALGGLMLGSLVATLLTIFSSPETLQLWLWRIPFLLSAILGMIGYYLRRFLNESAVFTQLIKTKTIATQPALLAFKHHWRTMLLAIGICVITGIAQYLMYTYFPSFMVNSTHISLSKALLLNTFAMIITVLVLPPFARLSDKYGRRPILIIGTLGFIILSLPIFYSLSQPSIFLNVIGIACYGALVGITSSPMPALYMELFPTHIRYSAIAISYNIAFAIFAGTGPVLATLFVKIFHTNLAPAYLLIFAAIISLICYLLMPETAGKEL